MLETGSVVNNVLMTPTEKATPPGTTNSLIRSPAAPLIAFFALIAIVYACLASHLTFNLFYFELKSAAYDSLADSLKRGEVTVSLRHIYDEAKMFQGRVYMYFGAFPALPRLFLNELFPQLFGLWGRLSCIAAALLSVAAFADAMRAVLQRKETGELTHASKILFWLLSAGFALGSPLVFLVSAAYIYHEASLWGLAWSLVAIAGYFELKSGRAESVPRSALKLSLGMAFALHSRLTFGFPFLIAGVLLLSMTDRTIRASLRERFPSGYRLRFILILPVLTAVFIQAWFNVGRFGSVFSAGSNASVGHAYFDQAIAHGGTFSISRIGTAVNNYFGNPSGYLDDIYPYVHTRRVSLPRGALYPSYQEWTVSLLLTLPWLLLLAGRGLVVSIRHATLTDRYLLFGFLAQAGLILGYLFVTQRYVGDFIPGLCFLALLGLEGFRHPGSLRLPGRALVVSVILLVQISIPANFLSTLSWNLNQNWGLSPEDRLGLEQIFGPRPIRSGIPFEYKQGYHRAPIVRE